MHAFVTQRWLITVRANAAFRIQPALERWERSPDLAAYGISFMLYALADYDVISDRIFAQQPLDSRFAG